MVVCFFKWKIGVSSVEMHTPFSFRVNSEEQRSKLCGTVAANLVGPDSTKSVYSTVLFQVYSSLQCMQSFVFAWYWYHVKESWFLIKFNFRSILGLLVQFSVKARSILGQISVSLVKSRLIMVNYWSTRLVHIKNKYILYLMISDASATEYKKKGLGDKLGTDI